MKRTPLKRVGNVGKANLEYKKLVKDLLLPEYCEVNLEGCLGGLYLTLAHKHKRSWYKGNAQLLADPTEFIVACVGCHNKIEHDKTLTESFFEKLR